LEFVDRRMMATQMKTLQSRYSCSLAPGGSAVFDLVEKELEQYFAGDLREFSVPIDTAGTEFQRTVWNRLLAIPYGETLSYSQMAGELGRPDAQRAVGKANGDNRIAIIVPCHRVVKADGTLCGYGGGLWRKQRLLELESGQLALL
jgi:AraC family transcriptional regulator of adaptative response/methylated-DNA-[protein]-cysteine methyltransferase